MKRRYLLGGLILVVVLLVAAIVIPCLMPAGSAASEASVAASIGSINRSEQDYRAAYGGYADSLANLGGAPPCTPSAATACLLDPTLSGGTKFGYSFEAIGIKSVRGANTGYVAAATPLIANRTGTRRFCSTEDGLVRMDPKTDSSVAPNAEACAGFRVLE
jgi:hypothetical protein